MTRFSDDAPTHVYLNRRGYRYYLLDGATGWRMDEELAGVWAYKRARAIADMVALRMRSRAVQGDEIGLTYAGVDKPVQLDGAPK